MKDESKRFRLDPTKSAKENLYDAARIASCVVARRYRWYGLVGEYRQELLERMILATVVNFIEHKVMQHKYMRVSKEGVKLSFMSNVLSSAWGISAQTVKRYMAELSVTSKEVPGDLLEILHQQQFPLYVSEHESKRQSYEKQVPAIRAKLIREEYEDYVADAEDLGIAPVSFESWLASTEYSKDGEAMYKLLSPEEQKELTETPKNVKPDSELTEEQLMKRFYNREYKKRKKAKEAEAKRMEEYRRKHIAPPGYHFVIIGGVEYIRKNT